MAERLYDDDGKLSFQARESLVAWMRARSVLVNCCATPQWAIIETLQSWTHVTENNRGIASIKIGEGLPVVTMACRSCAQLRSFNLGIIFPEWMDKQFNRKPTERSIGDPETRSSDGDG